MSQTNVNIAYLRRTGGGGGGGNVKDIEITSEDESVAVVTTETASKITVDLSVEQPEELAFTSGDDSVSITETTSDNTKTVDLRVTLPAQTTVTSTDHSVSVTQDENEYDLGVKAGVGITIDQDGKICNTETLNMQMGMYYVKNPTEFNAAVKDAHENFSGNAIIHICTSDFYMSEFSQVPSDEREFELLSFMDFTLPNSQTRTVLVNSLQSIVDYGTKLDNITIKGFSANCRFIFGGTNKSTRKGYTLRSRSIKMENLQLHPTADGPIARSDFNVLMNTDQPFIMFSSKLEMDNCTVYSTLRSPNETSLITPNLAWIVANDTSDRYRIDGSRSSTNDSVQVLLSNLRIGRKYYVSADGGQVEESTVREDEKSRIVIKMMTTGTYAPIWMSYFNILPKTTRSHHPAEFLIYDDRAVVDGNYSSSGAQTIFVHGDGMPIIMADGSYKNQGCTHTLVAEHRTEVIGDKQLVFNNDGTVTWTQYSV